jgi:hypothetical protein
VDEFLSLLTETERGEMSDVVSAAMPNEPSEAESLISDVVSDEPSETVQMPSDSSIEAGIESDDLLSTPTPTTQEEQDEDTFRVFKTTTTDEKVEKPAALDGTDSDGDDSATFRATPLDEIEKVFAKFSQPVRGELYESRAITSPGYNATRKRNAVSTKSFGKTEKYLAVVAALVLISSLLTYWMWPVEDASRSAEATARDSDDSRRGSNLQTTLPERNRGANPPANVEWRSALQAGPGDQSLNQGVGANPGDSAASRAAYNQSRLAATRTANPDQAAREKPLPSKKQEKAENKKVTADDLINDKKKVTVDDLINDN